MTYDNFCKAHIRSGRKTAISIECKCEGWYTASEAIFALAIEEKNQLCHRLQEWDHLTTTEIDQLQTTKGYQQAQPWSLWIGQSTLVEWNMHQQTQHVNEPIPNMGKHPSPHRRRNSSPQTNVNMAMRLKSGALAFNSRENISIFSMHFHNILNNNKPLNDLVLDLIEQKPCLTAIDTPFTFREVKYTITKLKKGNVPGLAGIR